MLFQQSPGRGKIKVLEYRRIPFQDAVSAFAEKVETTGSCANHAELARGIQFTVLFIDCFLGNLDDVGVEATAKPLSEVIRITSAPTDPRAPGKHLDFLKYQPLKKAIRAFR